jgi:hypothetical protein
VNDGKFYIGNLGLFPITPDSSKVMSFDTGACPWPFLFGFGCGDGFTTVVAIDFGPDGYLYVSNFGAAPTGQILRISVH